MFRLDRCRSSNPFSGVGASLYHRSPVRPLTTIPLSLHSTTPGKQAQMKKDTERMCVHRAGCALAAFVRQVAALTLRFAPDTPLIKVCRARGRGHCRERASEEEEGGDCPQENASAGGVCRDGLCGGARESRRGDIRSIRSTRICSRWWHHLTRGHTCPAIPSRVLRAGARKELRPPKEGSAGAQGRCRGRKKAG